MTTERTHLLYLAAKPVLLGLLAAILGAALGAVPRPAVAQVPVDSTRASVPKDVRRLRATVLPAEMLAPARPRDVLEGENPLRQSISVIAKRPSSSTNSSTARWTLVVDGKPSAWPGEPPSAPPARLRDGAQEALQNLRRKGYYYARIDSAVVTSNRSLSDAEQKPPAEVRVHVHTGPRVVLDSLAITGARAVPSSRLRRQIDARSGHPLDAEQLERDLDAMLQVYEDAGYPLAQIRIAETRLHPGDPPRLTLQLDVEEGPKLWLKRVTVPDDARTSPALVAYVADLEIGAPLIGYDPASIRRRVEASGLFASAGAPELSVGPDGGATLFVPVEETAPGSFDLVLGYLPPSQNGGGGQVVGSGHLTLRNLFGGGRTAALKLDRRPGQGSLFDVSAADPYLLGWPLRVEAQFQGEQRDSTFGHRRYRLGIGYRFDDGLEVTGSLSREVTRPGQAGARIRDGRQQIPRAEALFYGVGVRYQSVDRPVNPRRGGRVTVTLEQGTKDRRFFRRTTEGDTTRVRESLRQERITGMARLYVPVFGRQVVAVGLDASVLLSDTYDRSDLFRIGGAESLRGYDEDRFLGNAVGRALIEYRVQIDRVSYAYAFTDLGVVERPAFQASEGSRTLHPGSGIGIQFGTALGLVNASYALSPDDPSPANGRIHLGLSVDL